MAAMKSTFLGLTAAALAGITLQACGDANTPPDNSFHAYWRVKEAIKSAATDPRSFHEISHTVAPSANADGTTGPGYTVSIEFTTTNAFGGPVRQTVTAKTDQTGNALTLVGNYDQDGNPIG